MIFLQIMKNLTFASIVLFAFCSIFCSCESEKGVKTTHGYRFVNHTNKPGDKVTFGQAIKLHVETYMGDSLLQSTRKNGGAAISQQMPDSTRMASMKTVPPVFDALFLMTEGDSATIYQPVDSIIEKYIPEHLKGKVKEITYKIELVDVESTAEMEAKKAISVGLENTLKSSIMDLKEGKLEGKLAISPNKVKILVLEAGNGEKIASGEQVSVDYIGSRMTDMVKFDESYSRGQTLDFVVGAGQMIPGFDEAVLSLKHGAKAVIFIPYAQAYGEQGQGDAIPAKTDIAFYIDVK
jgi:FKBP-type peptidyl-prolyl cis-trans isomerase FkpA